MLPFVLGTAPAFVVLELGALLAVARVVSSEPFAAGRDEAGGWLAASILVWLALLVDWLGYGLAGDRSFARQRRRGADDVTDLWRAERFAGIAFWTASAAMVMFVLAAVGAISLAHGLTVAGTFAGPLPVLWFAALPAYKTRPPGRWVRRDMDAGRLHVIYRPEAE